MIYMFLLLLMEGILIYVSGQNLLLHGNAAYADLLIIINSVLYLFILTKIVKTRVEYVIFMVSYLLRILFLYIDIHGRGFILIPNSGADTEFFHGDAVSYLSGGEVHRGALYSKFIANIYYYFGPQRIIAQYVNLLLSMSVILICKRILDTVVKSAKIRLVALSLIAFIPNYLFLSVILLRESLIIFLMAASFLLLLRWMQQNNIVYLVASLCLTLVAAMFHSGAIAAFAAYAIITALYHKGRQRLTVTPLTVIALLVFTYSFLYLYSSYSNVFFQKIGIINDLSDISSKTTVVHGRSAYLEGLTADTPVKMILYTPIRILYFLAAPLPWDWRGLADIIAFCCSSMFYIYCYILAFKAIRLPSQQQYVLQALLLIAFMSAMVFAWGVSNAGTALRHRDKFIIFYVLIYAISKDTILQYLPARIRQAKHMMRGISR